MRHSPKSAYSLTLLAGDSVADHQVVHARNEREAMKMARQAAQEAFREVKAALAIGWRIVSQDADNGWSACGQVA